MSVGSNLQEMENVVTKGAAAAEPMQKLTTGIPAGQTGAWEDLGGPTPENYTNDPEGPAKLKDSAGTLAQVKDVVNAKAVRAEEVEEETEETLVSEEEAVEETAEEETAEGGEETTEEEVEQEVEEEFDIEEDVNALLAGEDLSEEFQEKAKIIFEAAIKAKVADIKEQLQSSYEQALVEEIEAIKEGLTERIDAYLEYVADEWIQENALTIEHGLKTEMTASFLDGMKQLFEDHYVTIPEERYDVIESMVDKLDEMETKLNEQIEKNITLNKRLAESVADVIFAEVSEGLALSQKDKLASLAENVEFGSEADYREKLVTLRDSYFSNTISAQRDDSENLSEGVEIDHQPVSGLMESYLQTLGRVSKK
jgi:hypothetical protein